MRKGMMTAAAVLLAGAVSAEMLVSWEGDSVQSPVNATLGVSGIVYYGAGVNNGRGSDDGTYGPIGSGAAATAFGYNTRNNAWTDFRISNNSGQDLQLSEIVFDYYAIWATGPQQIEVIYNYGALDDANATLLTTIDAPGFSGAGGTYDYPDYSVNLQFLLTDYTLATGQSATFTLKGANASDSGVSGVIDNIAFTGTVIPEPATFGLMALVTLGALFIRRFSI